MQVFMSYSSRDRVEALKLKTLVDAPGHDAWMDVFDVRAVRPSTPSSSRRLLLQRAPIALATGPNSAVVVALAFRATPPGPCRAPPGSRCRWVVLVKQI